MAAITQSELLDDISDALKKAGQAYLAAYWSGHATKAVAFALNEVVGAFIARGFTQAQILAADRLNEWTADLALWHALVRGGMLDAVDARLLESLDRRKELATAQLAVNGLYVNPEVGTSGPGQIGSGTAVGTGSANIFNMPGLSFTNDSQDGMRF